MDFNFIKYFNTFTAATALVFLSGCFSGPPRQESRETSINISASDVREQQAPKIFSANQRRLLQLAFDTASAVPARPHIKTRCRLQERAATVALELDQPQLAEAYVTQIKDWRRGTGHAFIGLYYARNDESVKAREQLEIAEKIAYAIKDWHKERIKTHIARAYILLGEAAKARELTSDIEELEAARAQKTEARVSRENQFEEQVGEIEKLLDSERFDIKRQALIAACQLVDNFYDDSCKRQQLESIITSSWDDIPVFVRIDLILRMTESALGNNDKARATNLTQRAADAYNNATWKPRHGIPVQARIAALTYRAGERSKAESLAEEALMNYREKEKSIVNIYRADTLVPLAEAYATMGNSSQALKLFHQALDAGFVNPNSRPRAEDLAMICCSMVKRDIEPSPTLWEHLRERRNQLGDPW